MYDSDDTEWQHLGAHLQIVFPSDMKCGDKCYTS